MEQLQQVPGAVPKRDRSYFGHINGIPAESIPIRDPICNHWKRGIWAANSRAASVLDNCQWDRSTVQGNVEGVGRQHRDHPLRGHSRDICNRKGLW